MRQVTAIGVAVVIFCLVCFILRKKGLLVQACAVSYVVSLVSLQLVMKQISSPPYSYRFPCWVTFLHYLTLVVTISLPLRASFKKIYTWRQYCIRFAPVALSAPLCIAFNNTALIYIGAGINAVVGTLTPANTAALQHCLGRRLSKKSWVGIFIAWSGGCLIAQGEISSASFGKGDVRTSEAMKGLVYAFVATLLRSLKAVLADQIMSPGAYAEPRDSTVEQPLSALEALALQSPLGALVAGCYALTVESPREAWNSCTPSAGYIVLLSCPLALAVGALGITSISLLGAASAQMVGKLNIVVIMAFSAAFMGEELQAEVVVGTLLVLAGIWAFETTEAWAKAAAVLPHNPSAQDKSLPCVC